MRKIGVIGAGHLGKIHINCIKEISGYDLVGFYDVNPLVASDVQQKYNIPAFENFEELLEKVDVIDIVTPTVSHFEYAKKSLEAKKHVFIEKPIVTTLEEAKELMKISKNAGVQIQIGHVERFNPAFLATRSYINEPKFIEAHRLSYYNPRGTDVPVVLDLMIHDIDILLTIIDSPIKGIYANGVPVLTQNIDIANARIEFEDGSVANLTASRISMKKMRKMRLFQQDSYISMDFLNKQSEVIKIEDNIKNDTNDNVFSFPIQLNNDNLKYVVVKKINLPEINAIKTELEKFLESIELGIKPEVTIDDGYKVLDVAYKIINEIQYNLSNLI
ncbi:MAG: Gfo/Idh/MocA family oxidoreductase [Bacteroidales bacterium]|jgi:predicted dehydrogenase|nr:Gfo/Idh/MocA family oxidoreductase [Bacteroidales bacterium]MDD3755905.1 Gfo/Idh/MocA family oxidoreductase [Bacteroidales bacterium]MDY0400851.1 Gfo/Idh/MocA family oxidoreductase [Bacteroidales bacterium]HHW58841.1 Gfo/Idh/MocA family oxidoreductase [Bacteroidales bacterium]HOB77703.1 Gfo/Idh/MocA family oxidoreductase [Bacteroidales bacterium]